jgi:hypothetical protein
MAVEFGWILIRIVKDPAGVSLNTDVGLVP